ncbi:hypothetical protein KSP39_PZI023036 [Platanthera zijinensis]|uniref:Serine-rich protein-like protein n=1 Tax=Platanthera zijinensis TaxID=2320716 RepID=A0AAP0AUJ4_9ASPA
MPVSIIISCINPAPKLALFILEIQILMAATLRNQSADLGIHASGGFRRFDSPSGRLFYSDSAGGFGRHSSSAFSSSPSSTSCSSSSDFFHHRAASPTRSKLAGSPSGGSLDFIAAKRSPISSAAPSRKTCMCSPTTHPGSYRCSLHKGISSPRRAAGRLALSSPSSQLYARRSAMTNSPVRIGTAGGEWVKRALSTLIRPSSHQQRRRSSFNPRPSRLSVMSKADESAI